MSNILTIAYTTEGTTDQRFLQNIIRKTFEELALSCQGLIEIYDPIYIRFDKKHGFVKDVVSLSVQAFKNGINIFCIHVDADSSSADEVLENKIIPATDAVNLLNDSEVCKNIIAIIPIHMSEAWMLADKNLLKEEIGTDKSDEDLGLTRHPESIADPKRIIENALNVAQIDLPRRRNRLTISELYQPIGQKISINRLETLDSFKSFKLSVEEALRKLNYLN